MKVLFLVNGSQDDADGMRATRLARHLAEGFHVVLAFRKSNKLASVGEFLRQALRENPDIIITIKMAYSGVVAGLVSKAMGDCKVICETGDATYALSKASGRYSRAELLCIWGVERLGLSYSDWVITRGTYHKDLLIRSGAKHVSVIPDGVDTTLEYPLDGEEVRAELGLSNRFVVGLVGSMNWLKAHSLCYGWELIEALPFLRDLPVSMLLVGDGSGRCKLEARAIELSVQSEARFVGHKNQSDLGRYLGAMDVCVSTQTANVVGMVRTTGKLPIYLAHDKYVIATDVGEAQRVLPGIGKLLPYVGVVDSSYPERLAKTVRELFEKREQVNLCGAARRVAQTEFEYSVLGRRLQKVIELAVRVWKADACG